MPPRTATDNGHFPAWFVRFVVSTAIGWFLSLILQLAGGVWWAATISAKVDSIQVIMGQSVNQNAQRISEAREDIKVLQLQIQKLEKELAVLLDRRNRQGDTR